MLLSSEEFFNKEKKIAILGLGYVGLPLAVALSRKFDVIGFDINSNRVKELIEGYDITGEVSSEDVRGSTISFTDDPAKILKVSIIIATVPTPIDNKKQPDLNPLRKASKLIGQYLTKDTIVVFESTVYPGVTEEVCVPIIEEASGLKCGDDFKVGYSPERINPGDKKRSVADIVKIVAGQDEVTTKLLSEIYGSVITAGTYPISNIKIAEAAKVIENIQRDLNIALMNELSLIFDRMGISTIEVLKAAGTKWNFMKFEPGLVGGHCIGVDPYYLTHKAEESGYSPKVILAGRKVNDQMGRYIADKIIEKLNYAGKVENNAKVLLLGITFKENVSDIRNTRVVDIYTELKKRGVDVYLYDPHANLKEVQVEYGIEMMETISMAAPYDAVVISTKHTEFLGMKTNEFLAISTENPIFIDVKNAFDRGIYEDAGFTYWAL